MKQLPPNLGAKVRQYRFGYGCVAVAETLCLAAALLGLFHPQAAWLALGWLGWRWWRRPTAREIARRLETARPSLREQLVSVVELSEHADGSAQLRQRAFAEIDRQVAGIEVSRLVSLRPFVGMVAAAVIVNVAVGVHRQRVVREARRAAVVAERPAAPVGHETPRLPVREKMDVSGLADAVRRLPEDVRRQLPAHVRSLDAAEAAARRAAAGEDVAFHRAQAAELLSEFARLASEVPVVAALAEQAAALAREFADSAEATAAEGVTPATGPLGSGGDPKRVPGTRVLGLPMEPPASHPWQVPVWVDSSVALGPPLSVYEWDVTRYFDSLVGLSAAEQGRSGQAPVAVPSNSTP